MTRIEKVTIIKALEAYRDRQAENADIFEIQDQYAEASKAKAEKNIAAGLICSFQQILNEQTGTVKI